MKEQYTDPWKGYGKKYATIYYKPGRPTEHEKQIYESFISEAVASGIDKPKILTLGGTPAVRDAAAKYSDDIICVDVHLTVLKELTTLITHNKKEALVNANWLDLPFLDNSFDIVIGDLVLPNIDKEHTPTFLDQIKKVLKPGGFFIHRIFFMPDNWAIKSAEEIFDYFDELRGKEKSQEMFVYFLFNSFDSTKNEFPTSRILEQLRPFVSSDENGFVYDKSKYVEQMLNTEFEMWKPFKKVWHAGTKDYVLGTLNGFFDVQKEAYADDHLLGREFPIVMCKPKD